MFFWHHTNEEREKYFSFGNKLIARFNSYLGTELRYSQCVWPDIGNKKQPNQIFRKFDKKWPQQFLYKMRDLANVAQMYGDDLGSIYKKLRHWELSKLPNLVTLVTYSYVTLSLRIRDF